MFLKESVFSLLKEAEVSSAAKSWNYGWQVRQQRLHPEPDAEALNYLWESKGNMTVFKFYEWITARTRTYHSRALRFMNQCRTALQVIHGKSVSALGLRTLNSSHKWKVLAEQFAVKEGISGTFINAVLDVCLHWHSNFFFSCQKSFLF